MNARLTLTVTYLYLTSCLPGSFDNSRQITVWAWYWERSKQLQARNFAHTSVGAQDRAQCSFISMGFCQGRPPTPAGLIKSRLFSIQTFYEHLSPTSASESKKIRLPARRPPPPPQYARRSTDMRTCIVGMRTILPPSGCEHPPGAVFKLLCSPSEIHCVPSLSLLSSSVRACAN